MALVLLLLLLMMSLVACGSRGEEAAQGEPVESEMATVAGADASEQTATATTDVEAAAVEATQDQSPVQIGVLVPLSAPGAVAAGLSMVDAMTIAVDELNEQGGILGRPVELIVQDSGGQPDKAVEALTVMLGENLPVAITGVYHSSVAMAIKNLAGENGIPILFTEPWTDDVTVGQIPDIFRIAPMTSEATAVDYEFIASLPYEINHVAIVVEDTDFGIPAMEGLRAGLTEADIDVTAIEVESAQSTSRVSSGDLAGLSRILLSRP